MEQKLVKKKLVTVRCNNPFSYRKIPFAGICNRVVLEVEAINYALMNKAFVVEHLKNNKDIPLGFDNYNTYNGPTLIDDDTDLFNFKEPEIEMIDGFGNHTIINKQESQITKPIMKHIDLEEEKRKKALEEEKIKARELQIQKQKEREAKEAKLKEEIERSKKEREEAAAKILAEAQAKADREAGVDIKRKEEYNFDFPGSTKIEEPVSDFTKSDNKKSNYDKKDKRK